MILSLLRNWNNCWEQVRKKVIELVVTACEKWVIPRTKTENLDRFWWKNGTSECGLYVFHQNVQYRLGSTRHFKRYWSPEFKVRKISQLPPNFRLIQSSNFRPPKEFDLPYSNWEFHRASMRQNVVSKRELSLFLQKAWWKLGPIRHIGQYTPKLSCSHQYQIE